jgi:hypothetical protein
VNPLGRPVVPIAALFFAVLILYVASSGPVLRYLFISYHSSAETGVLYQPMFAGAAAAKLQAPLDAYLFAWDVVVIDANGASSMVSTKERAEDLVPQIKAYKAGMRRHSS